MPGEIEPGLGLSDGSGGLQALSRGASFYMSAKGVKQGAFAGSSTTEGQTGKIEVLGVECKTISPRDIASGLPSGRHVCHPVHVAFKLDKSTPLWLSAIGENETLKDVTIDYWSGLSKASGVGQGTGFKKVYTWELKNAQVANMTQFTGVNGEACVVLALTYQSITYTWADGGIDCKANWLENAEP
jgi:type VI secretion system secreted protein Hcp